MKNFLFNLYFMFLLMTPDYIIWITRFIGSSCTVGIDGYWADTIDVVWILGADESWQTIQYNAKHARSCRWCSSCYILYIHCMVYNEGIHLLSKETPFKFFFTWNIKSCRTYGFSKMGGRMGDPPYMDSISLN